MTAQEPPENAEKRAEIQWLDLYPVYDAPDEDSAIHVQALLVGAGIEARVRSAQVPGFDGAFAMAVGYWGQVLVPRREVLRAKALLTSFRNQAEAQAAEDENTER